MENINKERGHLVDGDEQIQLFKNCLELNNNDAVKAFITYTESVFDPEIKDLKQRLSEAEAKLINRNAKTPEEVLSDINHCIEFIKKLGPGESPTYETYKNYCIKYKVEIRHQKSKFYDILPLSIKKILIADITEKLPKNFTRKAASEICEDWRLPVKYLDELLQDENLFIKLPLDLDEKKSLNLPANSEVYQRF